TNAIGVAKWTDTPPVIDGVLDEVWDGSGLHGFEGRAANAPPDATWGALWDAEKLYLLVRIRNDLEIDLFDSLSVYHFFLSGTYNREFGSYGDPSYNETDLSIKSLVLPQDVEILLDVVPNTPFWDNPHRLTM